MFRVISFLGCFSIFHVLSLIVILIFPLLSIVCIISLLSFSGKPPIPHFHPVLPFRLDHYDPYLLLVFPEAQVLFFILVEHFIFIFFTDILYGGILPLGIFFFVFFNFFTVIRCIESTARGAFPTLPCEVLLRGRRAVPAASAASRGRGLKGDGSLACSGQYLGVLVKDRSM